jgi:hypothetical protein
MSGALPPLTCMSSHGVKNFNIFFKRKHSEEIKGTVSQNTTVIFGGAFNLG